MNSEDQQILCNLRMLGKLQKDQWIVCDYDLNIIGMCDDTYWIRRDSWYLTLECLKHLYCKLLPELVNKLMNRKFNKFTTEINEPVAGTQDDLKRVDALLVNSIDGIKLLKEQYHDPVAQAHLDSIENDFANAIHEKIKAEL